jgi:uncharacterized protein YjcR
MASWAEEYGISADTVWARLDRGWEVGDALRVPVNKHETIVEYGGLGMPLTAWAERMGINRATLKSRLALGWSISDALETPVHQKDR